MPNYPLAILLFNDTRTDYHFGCDAVMDAIEMLIGQAGIPLPLYSYPLTESTVDRKGCPMWLGNAELPGHIFNAGIAIVNGEGSIHHSNRRARGLSPIGLFAKNMGLPSALINTTLYKNDRTVYEQIAQFSLIYVRDTASQKLLEGLGIESKYAPDMTFFHDFEMLEDKTHNGSVCVGNSVHKHQQAQLEAYRKHYNWEKCSIIHSPGNESNIDDYAAYVRHLKDFGLVVTGRYHDICFCINAKIPFVVVESNTDKVKSLLQDVFGDDHRQIKASQLLKLNVEEFDFFSENELANINQFKQRARQQFLAMQQDLEQLVELPMKRKTLNEISQEIDSMKKQGVPRVSFMFWWRTWLNKIVKKFR